jgi:hypothetical protein
LFVVLGLLAFGGFVLSAGGPVQIAIAAEEEADVAAPAPEEGAEEATEGEAQEEGEEKAEEGEAQPE